MSKMKSLARKYAPPAALVVATNAYRQWIAHSVSRYDKARFSKARFRQLRGARLEQIEGKLVFHAHALEKGLSQTNLRYNFGERAIRSIAESIEAYHDLGYPRDRLAYLSALSTLQAYAEAHETAGVKPDLLHKLVSPQILREANRGGSDSGGIRKVTSPGRYHGRSFAQVFLGRSSVREFANRAVSSARIMPAIEMATKSPSVCNRQSSRVKLVTDVGDIRKLLELQGGFSGYPPPPALLVLTSDMSSFLNPTERNQPFIDGGLFSMGLLLSLENVGLAACPLNTMMTVAKEEAVRKMLNIPMSERLIMFIAVGEFKSHVNVPLSFRYPAEEITDLL